MLKNTVLSKALVKASECSKESVKHLTKFRFS